ncbi:hypothetical protein QGN29_05815 [Temperatibacter marinus]|uniref:Uncharacterized protein n=1 Tax=Temperatibacter marinus TaxID=1456591 RepID=A0AA52EEB2_9PROT|nr:hypothetical protein [Temperatibacter marinus]WND03887.1 hypothetical protein QGN29_05815 [Temperatibacter marinus]
MTNQTASIDPFQHVNAKSKGKRPKYFDDPAMEHLMSMNLSLMQELAVTRERLDSLERVMEDTGILPRSKIESYRPDTIAAQERALAHRKLISTVLRSVEQELDGMKPRPEGTADS